MLLVAGIAAKLTVMFGGRAAPAPAYSQARGFASPEQMYDGGFAYQSPVVPDTGFVLGRNALRNMLSPQVMLDGLKSFKARLVHQGGVVDMKSFTMSVIEVGGYFLRGPRPLLVKAADYIYKTPARVASAFRSVLGIEETGGSRLEFREEAAPAQVNHPAAGTGLEAPAAGHVAAEFERRATRSGERASGASRS